MTDRLVGEVVINDNASAALTKVEQALDKVTAAEARTATATTAVSETLVKSTRAADTAARGFESVARSADPVYAVTTRLTDAQQKLQRAVDLGVRSQIEAARVNDQLVRQSEATIAKLQGATTAHADLTKASGTLTNAFALNRNGMLELQAAGINAFQALASGMSPLRVATMEGAQAFGAFAQGGLGVSGILRAIISPIGLAVTAGAALAGGFALGALRAAELERESRDLGVALEGMGKSGQTSAAGLIKVREELTKFGLARADASAAILAVARAPLVPAQLTGRIVTGAANESAIRGTDVLTETQALTAAIAGGAAGLEKYLLDRNAATASDLAAMRQQERLGDQIGVVKRALDSLDLGAGGKYQKSLTDWQQFWHAMGEALDAVLDKLAKTPPLIRAATAAAGDLTLREGQLGINIPVPSRAEAAIPPVPRNTAGVAGGDYATNFSIRPNVNMTGLVPQIADMLSHAAETLPPGFSIEISSGGRPGGSRSPVGMGSAHVPGLAADYQLIGPGGERYPNIGNDTTGLYGKIFQAAQDYAAWAYPNFGLRNGATFGANGGPISARSPADIGHIDLRGVPGATTAGANEVAKLNEEYQRQVTILNAAQKEREALSAKEAAYKRVLDDTHDAVAANNAGQVAYDSTLRKSETTFRDETDAMGRAAVGAGAVADAWVQSRAAAMAATAGVQAHDAASTRLGVSEEQLKTAILNRTAAQISEKAGEAIANTQEQVAATQNLAKAELQGAAAVQEAERVEKVRASTRDLYAAAAVTQDEATRQRLGRQIALISDLSLAETKGANDRAANALHFQQLHDRTVAELQQQIALETDPGRIQAQNLAVQHLNDEFSIRQRLKGATEDQVQAALRESDAIRSTQAATQALGAIRDKARSIADDVGQFLLDGFVNASKGGKSVFDNLLDSIDAGFKRLVANIAVDFAKQQVILPITTEIVGSVPGLFGLAGAPATAAAAGGGGGASGLSGSLLQGGGLLKHLFGDSAGSVGTNAAGVIGGVNGFEGSGILGSINAFGANNLGTFAGAPYAAGSGLLGATTLTSLLGGTGAGAAGGFLLNSLVGGNQLGGGIGSAGGALAGAVIGSIVPGIGTLIGGLVGGGAGGLFGGPLGNDRSTVADGEIVLT